MRVHGDRVLRTHGFTLVELLVSVLIVAILAGLLVSAILIAWRKAKENQTRTLLNEIAVAVGMMRFRYEYDGVIGADADGNLLPGSTRDGIYFLDEPFDIVKELAPSYSAWNGSFRPHLNAKWIAFFEVKKHMTFQGKPGDPWGNAIRYGIRIAKQTAADGSEEEIHTETIASAGDDEVLGTADDIHFEFSPFRVKAPRPPVGQKVARTPADR